MQLYWTIGVWSWLALAFITFTFLMKFRIAAPFGRHTRSGWGPTLNNSWGWFLMELPSLLCLWTAFGWGFTAETPGIAFIPMFLWTVHYVNRTFIFPIRLRDRAKRMPVFIVFSSIFFNVVNGTLNGYFLSQGWFYPSWVLMVMGGAIFCFGMWVNIRSDNYLLSLRKPGETHYRIPRGGLFDRVSSPNLLGEMVEWFGFFIAAPSLASLSFCAWTLANLLPRARDHQVWYRQYFVDYPEERKIVIPFYW